MKKIFALVATASLLFSCSQEVAPEFEKLPINISVGQQTRANDSTFENEDEVGIYVVNYDGSTAGTLTATGNQVDNERFTYNNGAWTPDETIYWKDQSTAADFYAYYPYSESVDIAAHPFAVMADQSAADNFWASDFLWGKAANVTPTSTAVPVVTNHSLSRIIVNVKPGNGFTEEAWAAAAKSVKVCDVVTSATIDLSTGTATATGDKGEITPLATDGVYKAMLVPQVVADNSKLVVVTVDGVDYVYRKGYTFKRNTQHTFTITVNKKGGNVDVTIGEWEMDESINEGNAEEESEATIPNNQIWYTCWDNKMVYPNTEKALDYFGANIIDHQFADNKGVITFDGDVKRINNIDAISGQNSLSTITLPESVEYVGERVLVGANLSEFHGKFASEDHLLLISNDTIVARTAYGFSSEYTIPDGVVHIGYGVFQRVPCEVVNMPNSVKSIGESAFSNCERLTTVNLSNCLESIGLSAFYWCGKLKNIVLPESFSKFDTYSIYGAGNVNGTFSGTGLIEIIIPAGVTTIPSHTFEYCSNLKSVILHDGIKEIKDMAFRNCPNLEMINFSNTLESIGNSSFGATQITSLSLPASIKMIGCLNFQDCSKLTIVECRAITPPDVTLSSGNSKWNTFLNHSTDSFRIKVPSISVDAYKAADGWNEYADCIVGYDF